MNATLTIAVFTEADDKVRVNIGFSEVVARGSAQDAYDAALFDAIEAHPNGKDIDTLLGYED